MSVEKTKQLQIKNKTQSNDCASQWIKDKQEFLHFKDVNTLFKLFQTHKSKTELNPNKRGWESCSQGTEES